MLNCWREAEKRKKWMLSYHHIQHCFISDKIVTVFLRWSCRRHQLYPKLKPAVWSSEAGSKYRLEMDFLRRSHKHRKTNHSYLELVVLHFLSFYHRRCHFFSLTFFLLSLFVCLHFIVIVRLLFSFIINRGWFIHICLNRDSSRGLPAFPRN